MARSDSFIRQCGRSRLSRSDRKAPADHEAELREAVAGFRKMWQEIPWGEK